MFRFAPKLPVINVQEISIHIDVGGEENRWIYIDNELVYSSLSHYGYWSEAQLLEFVQNDGFDTIEDFFNWFDSNFEGQIIHWTDLIY